MGVLGRAWNLNNLFILYWVANGYCILPFLNLFGGRGPAFFMELTFSKWVCAFLLCCWLSFSKGHSGMLKSINFNFLDSLIVF